MTYMLLLTFALYMIVNYNLNLNISTHYRQLPSALCIIVIILSKPAPSYANIVCIHDVYT